MTDSIDAALNLLDLLALVGIIVCLSVFWRWGNGYQRDNSRSIVLLFILLFAAQGAYETALRAPYAFMPFVRVIHIANTGLRVLVVLVLAPFVASRIRNN